jgi:hypothetical protein
MTLLHENSVHENSVHENSVHESLALENLTRGSLDLAIPVRPLETDHQRIHPGFHRSSDLVGHRPYAQGDLASQAP